LNELLKGQFGANVAPQQTSSAAAPAEEEPAVEEPAEDPNHFDFNFTPREIKNHLDRFVIRQDEAKKVLSVAICDHYNHASFMHRRKQAGDESLVEYTKQNVILIGPTGVGKTYLIKHIAELIGVPFVKADATKFSETGYVGGDVEDLVRELHQKADGNLELAEHGIIYIDEIDKLAGSLNSQGRDVSGRGVQTTLLKLMEETEVAIRNPMDIQAQLQAAFQGARGGKGGNRDSINTRHVLFIVSGAFVRLDEIIEKRVSQSRIGFHAEPAKDANRGHLLREASTSDLVQFGFEPEFIGRLPVRVVCDSLDESALYEIMTSSEGSLLRQYERAFEAYDIHVDFEDEALRRVASLAAGEGTGARGLMTVCERLLREFKYELPGTGVFELKVDKELIDEPQSVLERLRASGLSEREKSLEAAAKRFAGRFSNEHGISIAFDDGATRRLIEMAIEKDVSMQNLCAERFKDYQFGLNLIKKNSGQSAFTVTREAVDDPDSVLSQWVVASYGEDRQESAEQNS